MSQALPLTLAASKAAQRVEAGPLWALYYAVADHYRALAIEAGALAEHGLLFGELEASSQLDSLLRGRTMTPEADVAYADIGDRGVKAYLALTKLGVKTAGMTWPAVLAQLLTLTPWAVTAQTAPVKQTATSPSSAPQPLVLAQSLASPTATAQALAQAAPRRGAPAGLVSATPAPNMGPMAVAPGYQLVGASPLTRQAGGGLALAALAALMLWRLA